MNYRIEAIIELLNQDCILTRYDFLIPYKYTLVERLRSIGCLTKSDCLELPIETLVSVGLPDAELADLFRRFLVMYDVRPQKLKEIDTLCGTTEEKEAFRELYQLPGIKYKRALLYYKAGYRSLDAIASSSPEEIISKTEETIQKEKLELKVPLMKEVKTHRAVARVFTYYYADKK